MVLGALADAGLPLDDLRRELGKIPLTGYSIGAEKVSKNGFPATQFNVAVARKTGRSRTHKDIAAIIGRSKLSARLKERGAAVFASLARAEGKVHQVPAEEVRLHEVGAVDAIVDVMGVVIGLELMGIESLYASPLPSGRGSFKTDHGYMYPVPAPATMELLAAVKAPLVVSDQPWAGEMVTPTGAAIIATLASFQRPTLALEIVGCGAGNRDLPQIPNILRIWIGEEAREEAGLVLLETNIDDMSPQVSGYVMERLFELGARDVWFTPIFMKKNRPATMLSVLSPAGEESRMAEVILRETTTLGIRVRPVTRHEADRELIEFPSSLGRVHVKIKKFQGRVAGVSPEYEDCRRLAAEKGLPLQEVLRTVESEAYQHIKTGKGPA
ncbi:MAG: nickel pincer cofactor biosynthesis protein LarC [Chloroflexi bacterium]|nr:nickel pincer cofactor biosynthesis protein LarC [Chloroflexota bacterium]